MQIQNEIDHLKIQLDNYTEAIKKISKLGFSELTSVIGPILTVNESSLKSIILLAENQMYRDLIILSRPFLEAVLNVGFICADENAVVNSKKYAYQKGYRDLFRDLKVNGFNIKYGFNNYTSEFEKAAPQEMKDALSNFTTSKGKEINSWTPETAKAKLDIIGKSFGYYVNALLSFAFFSIYRDVSEIIHNSYYGVRIFIGMQQKDITAFKNTDEAATYFGDHQRKLATLIIQQINISICSLLNILNQKFQTEELDLLYEKSNNELIEYTSKVKSE